MLEGTPGALRVLRRLWSALKAPGVPSSVTNRFPDVVHHGCHGSYFEDILVHITRASTRDTGTLSCCHKRWTDSPQMLCRGRWKQQAILLNFA